MQLLNRLVAASLPELAAHLDDICLPLDLFATQVMSLGRRLD